MYDENIQMIIHLLLRLTLISQPLHTVMYVENSSNCWDTLRAILTTTQSEKISVNVKNKIDWAISSQDSLT